MRIVNREEFLSLPIGTVYQKYQPQYTEGLCIKEDSFENDFWFYHIDGLSIDVESDTALSILLEHVLENRKNFDVDFDILQRDGCFEPNMLFLVWEQKDVETLIDKLEKSLTLTRENTASKSQPVQPGGPPDQR